MLRTERYVQTTSISVATCPICQEVHDYDFKVMIDQAVGVMHMMTSRVERRTCAVTCPSKGGAFVVEVPVTLWSGQELVGIR